MRGWALVLAGFVVGAATVAIAGYLTRQPSQLFTNIAASANDITAWPPGQVFRYAKPIPLDSYDRGQQFYFLPYADRSERPDAEKAVVLSADGKALRRGDRLWLGFDDGTSMLMIDDPVCDNYQRCVSYILHAVEKDAGFLVVLKGGWEWFSALVISRRDGTMVETDGMPVFSPDRKLAIVSYLSMMDGAGEFSIFSAVDGKFSRLASCDGALEYLAGAEWIGPQAAIIPQSNSLLRKDETPVVQWINGKWRVMGPVTPTMSGKKDVPLDFECVSPKR